MTLQDLHALFLVNAGAGQNEEAVCNIEKAPESEPAEELTLNRRDFKLPYSIGTNTNTKA